MRVTVSLLLSYFSLRPLYVLSTSAQACSALAGSGCAAVQMTNAGLSQNKGFGAKRPVELPALVPRVFKKPCKDRAGASGSPYTEFILGMLPMNVGHSQSKSSFCCQSKYIQPLSL